MAQIEHAEQASEPHPDGFGGAQDTAILESYSGWKAGDDVPANVHVQAVKRTRGILKRAGIKRIASGEFYKVAVRHDEKFNRLQLA